MPGAILVDIDVIAVQKVAAVAMRLARLMMPAALDRLPQVLGVGADAQMPRIDARRIVAAMENPEAFGDWAVHGHIHEPVRDLRVAVVVGRTIAGRRAPAGPLKTARARWLRLRQQLVKQCGVI